MRKKRKQYSYYLTKAYFDFDLQLADVDSANQTLNSYLDDPLNGVYKIYFHTVSFSEDGWDVGPRMLKVPDNAPIKDGLKQVFVFYFLLYLPSRFSSLAKFGID